MTKTPQALARQVSHQSVAAGRLHAALPVFAAVMLGFFLLTAAGFAQVTHDVAHDTRHSLGFPCH